MDGADDTALLAPVQTSEPQESTSINDVLNPEELAEAIKLADHVDEDTELPVAAGSNGAILERQLSNDEFVSPMAGDVKTDDVDEGQVKRHNWASIALPLKLVAFRRYLQSTCTVSIAVTKWC